MKKSSSAFLAFLLSALFVSFSALAVNLTERKNKKVVSVNMYAEVTTLDPNKQLDALCSFWLGHLYEGLFTYDEAGKMVPAAASEMKLSKDKRTYEFKIRENAKWHDGKPVLAEEFVFSFRRLVDPKYASEYSFIAETAQIKNAKAIIESKLPPETLGVSAKPGNSFVVTLEKPVAFFLSLLALNPFFPVRRDLAEKYGNQFGVDAASVVGNGPFRLTSWKKETSMRLEKFKEYWNSKAIKIETIDMPSIVADSRSSYLMYDSGIIDLLQNLDSDVLKLAKKDKKAVKHMQSGVIWYLALNQRKGRLFSDKRLRNIVEVGLQKNEFVTKIVGLPGHRVANGLVPDMISSGVKGKSFRSLFPLLVSKPALNEAHRLLDEYVKANGGKSLGEIIFLMGSDPQNPEAEYLRDSFSKIFKTPVKLQVGPFKVRQQKLRDGDYDLAFTSWIPDYDDPLTYLELFTSGSPTNYGNYTSPRFDTLIDNARSLEDETKRIEALGQAERTLLDDKGVVPVEQSARSYVVRTGLEGVVRRVFGPDPDLRFASWK